MEWVWSYPRPILLVSVFYKIHEIVCEARGAADAGPGSLRERLANAGPGETISFDASALPPAAPVSIQLAAPSPALTQDGLTIDAGESVALLDGSSAPAGAAGFRVDSSKNAIAGLEIPGFPSRGVEIYGDRNLIGVDLPGARTVEN